MREPAGAPGKRRREGARRRRCRGGVRWGRGRRAGGARAAPAEKTSAGGTCRHLCSASAPGVARVAAAAAAAGGWRLRRRDNLCISYRRRRRHAPPVQTLSRGSCASGSSGGGRGRGSKLGGGTARGWGRGGLGRERAREGGDAGAGRCWLTRRSQRCAGARPTDWRARGWPPRAGRREAHPARAPAALHRLPRPIRCHLTPPLSRKRAWLPTHTQPGEKCFCSRWAVVSQEFDVIISQNGTEKLRVASFLPLSTVQKNRCASPRLQNGSDYRIKELRK